MLTKQGIDISFAQGLDTKTDPKRVQIGKFLELENTVLDKGDLLQKRNGYGGLASLPDMTYSYLTTFNGTLTALGPNIAAYNTGGSSWVSKGTIDPLSLETLPVLRNNLNQTACDIAVASNGVACAVYLESDGSTTTAKYVVFDSVTGQNLSAPAVIPVASGTVTGGMRVFVLGQNFIMVFTNVITATNHLQYVSVSITNPTIIGTNTDISSNYVPASTLSWDGFVAGSSLYLAYNVTSGGQAIKVTYLSTGLVLAAAVTFAGRTATMMTVTADTTNPASPIIYASFYDSASATGYSLAVDQSLNTIMVPTQIIAAGTILNIVSAARSGDAQIYFEVSNAYSYDSTIPTNYIQAVSITALTAAVSGIVTIVRSVGLASKAFRVNGVTYFLAAYQSPYQPTYFLISYLGRSSGPVIVAKLAYQNGGGYLTVGLPSVTVTDSLAQIGYRFKDLIQAVNKNTAVPSGTQTNGIYSQTGINMVSFLFGTDTLDTSEIGSDLQLSGGFLGMYDGYLPVENNFFLYPDIDDTTPTDTAAWTENSVVTPTGTFSLGGFTVVVSSATGISVGMTITDTSNAGYIPAGTQITAISGTTLTINKAATHAAAGDNLSIQGNIASKPDGSTLTNAYYYQATYEWTDNQGNAFRSAPSIPVAVTTTGVVTTGVVTLHLLTLRLTMKVSNPVKIVIYRWSVGQPLYYQVTSIVSPLLNSTTTDSVTFVDTLSDAMILGNNLLYTTGGVIENTSAPASNLLTLFDTRLWLVDAEDPNLLWFSKKVIEATPVEMSDLFTIFVPPTTSTQGTTGKITAISVMDDKLIIAKRNALLYINGSGPDSTGSNNQYSDPIFITSTVGCANQKSIILTPQGLMFQSNKGIWLLDRSLQTSYIGAPVQAFTLGATVTSAVTVPETNQVRFTLDTGITLMYDYFYGQWGTFVGVPCVSSCIYQDLHTFINDIGGSYQETPGQYLDGTNPVLMRFTTGPLRIGDLQNYQRAYFFYILGTYISPHKLWIGLTYDYEESPSQSLVISPTNYSTPFGSGASQSPFGQGDPFGGPSNLENWRVFLERQRCMAFGITVQEIFDASIGASAGAGLTISGLNVICAFKKAFRPQPAASTTG